MPISSKKETDPCAMATLHKLFSSSPFSLFFHQNRADSLPNILAKHPYTEFKNSTTTTDFKKKKKVLSLILSTQTKRK